MQAGPYAGFMRRRTFRMAALSASDIHPKASTEVEMSTETALKRNAQQRRANAVYSSLAHKRPMIGILCAEMVALAVLTLAIAGIIGLRAWLALPN